ncbi:MAG: hypothetical protein JW990_01910 [Thermoleophilia bacterium]|nr:hypothetical protein [Thermoleophilia bacterium]
MEPEQYDPNRGAQQHDPSRAPWPRNEKDEKGQEKSQEKGQGLDEKYRRNPLGFVAFAFVIIWLGVFLLLQNQGIFADGDRGWAIFFWGLAGIAAMEALIRLGIPSWRQPLTSNFVGAAVFTGIGFGLWTKDWEIIGPVVLIAIGLGILAGRLLPRR